MIKEKKKKKFNEYASTTWTGFADAVKWMAITGGIVMATIIVGALLFLFITETMIGKIVGICLLYLVVIAGLAIICYEHGESLKNR